MLSKLVTAIVHVGGKRRNARWSVHQGSLRLLPPSVSEKNFWGRKHLRSADNGLNDVPRVSSSVGSRTFSVAGPQAWNQLSTSIRQMDCIATFKRHLKTSLFMEAYTVCLINSLLLVKLLFPLIFLLFLLYCILCHFTLFSAAVQYCKRRYKFILWLCDWGYAVQVSAASPVIQPTEHSTEGMSK